MGTAFLEFGGAALGKPDGPFQTIRVEMRETDVPRSGATVSGYGAALPTRYIVKWAGRWWRVRAACYGNAATLYIGRPRQWLAIVSDIERDKTGCEFGVTPSQLAPSQRRKP